MDNSDISSIDLGAAVGASPARDGRDTGSDSQSETRDGHRTRATDLEKPGRSAEPANPLPSARKDPAATNLSRPERLGSLLAGAALIAYGLNRRGWAGMSMAAAGLALSMRGATGRCSVYGALGVNTAEGDSRETHGIHVAESITIDSPPEELYDFWRNFENHALISDYLAQVKVTGPLTSHWVAKGPANRPLEWDAEIINDRPNELIAWQTLPGADIEHAGSVRFKQAPGGRGTEVHVTMQYYPPAGALGAGIATLMRREPSIQAADTLKRLKRLMETGEIVKVDGQPHGPSLQRAALNPRS